MYKLAITITLTLSICACDNQLERMAQHEQTCLKALEHGILETADKECSASLGKKGEIGLAPSVRASRLLRLGSIKRQRTQYSEADTLVTEALNIAQTTARPASPLIRQCQHELALIAAGQEQWQHGSAFVMSLLRDLKTVPEQKRQAIQNMSRIYVSKLRKIQQGSIADQLESMMQKSGAE